MKTLIFLSTLMAFSNAQTWTPIHGCEWVPYTTAVTNFTFFHAASNGSTLDYVKWQLPAHSLACNLANPPATGSGSSIGNPGTSTTVPCKASGSDPTIGRLLVSADDKTGSNATVRNVVYAQCAATIYALYYEGTFALACTRNAGGSDTCVSRDNATATITTALYLPRVGPPPPPPPPWWL